MTSVIAPWRRGVGSVYLPTCRSLGLLHAVFVAKCNACRCKGHDLCCVSSLHIALQGCETWRYRAMHKKTVTAGYKIFHNESDKFYLLWNIITGIQRGWQGLDIQHAWDNKSIQSIVIQSKQEITWKTRCEWEVSVCVCVHMPVEWDQWQAPVIEIIHFVFIWHEYVGYQKNYYGQFTPYRLIW